MKIDKKLIKELVDQLSEFNLTELEYQEGQTKVKVSRASKGIEQIKSSSGLQKKAFLYLWLYTVLVQAILSNAMHFSLHWSD